MTKSEATKWYHLRVQVSIFSGVFQTYFLWLMISQRYDMLMEVNVEAKLMPEKMTDTTCLIAMTPVECYITSTQID